MSYSDRLLVVGRLERSQIKTRRNFQSRRVFRFNFL